MYVEIDCLKKSYGSGEGFVEVLKGISASVEKDHMCVIEGASGRSSEEQGIKGVVISTPNMGGKCHWSWSE